MILIIDNYDSFTHNLAQYVGDKHDEVHVLRNDHQKIYELAYKADALIFSPGPGWPKDAGQMEKMIEYYAGKKPILGICLGFQAIVEVFGGKLRLAKQVMHGKKSQMKQDQNNKIFKGLPSEVEVMRYHSIVMDEKSKLDNFEITGFATDDDEIMAIENEKLKIYGLQFHPESIGTPDGMAMIDNFLEVVDESSN
ncbi:anthranilate synthase component II [Floricoccus tropicus]|uniref:Anthranilate synthase component II n=1 Tax=Floricoccus tropicus TaxID=1859473 RepID=A0A1E8GQ35_9LACT|nr:aminodeoxychorismate/anthranilate synthase component II [Floricoccus tropicus]OFI49598.1 anthranilate synthase component II [Floricoccus tropicus]